MTQYDEYGTISSSVLDIFSNKVGIFDDYIAFRTGEYTYSCLVNPAFADPYRIDVSRTSSSGYTNYYEVSTVTDNWDYSYTNEYYVYSNVDVGQSLYCHDLDRVGLVTGLASSVLLVLVAFISAVKAVNRWLI